MWLINGMDRPERKSALSQDDCESQQAIGDTCHSQQHFKANINELREYVEGAQLVVKKDMFTFQENPEGNLSVTLNFMYMKVSLMHT